MVGLCEESKRETERMYQRLIIDRAIKENVIVCLPTGSGKTLIAISLIKHLLPTAIKERKKIVFLANKVHLINQQGKYIQSQLGITSDDGTSTVAIITGDLNTDFWTEDKWTEVLNQCDILVITSEIFKQILRSAFISFEQVALLIFDECHNAVGGDPMSMIVDSYAEQFRKNPAGRANLPKILGLTATIINTAAKVERIEQDITKVEDKFCSRVITHVGYSEVLGYSTSAKMEIKVFADYSDCPPLEWDYRDLSVLEGMQSIIDGIDAIKHKKIEEGTITHPSFEHPSQLYYSGKTMDKILKAVLEDVIGAYRDLGPYCANLAAKANMGYLYVLSDLKAQFGDQDVIGAINRALEALEAFVLRTESKFAEFSKDLQINIFISDKLIQLIQILLDWRGTGKTDYDKCGIVFVQKRITAQILHWYFEDAKEFLGGGFELLATDFVVGSSGSRWGLDYDNMHFTAKKQTEALTKFHNKETNVVFATSVLEEGLDVRNCNLGVRFDQIQNYPSYVQSMGRVRQPKAPFYVLVEKKDLEKERKKLSVYEAYNAQITAYLINKSISQDEFQLGIPTNGKLMEEEAFLPFCPEGKPGSPSVTMDSAIQLVYRYCATLPCDLLAVLCPYSWWAKAEGGFQAYLQFPSNSVITDVLKGPVAPKKDIAKQAVHLQACRLLHSHDALDDHLLPITIHIPKAANEFIENISAAIRRDGEGSTGKVGTRKRTQWYSKPIPNILRGGLLANENLVIYRLNLKTLSVPSGSGRSGLYDFEHKNYSFGFLTNQKVSEELEHIPQFPLFGKSSDKVDKHVIASFEKLRVTKMTAEELSRLRVIQSQIFDKVLRLHHSLLVDQESCFTIIPLLRNSHGGYDIWWDLETRLKSMEMKEFCANPPTFQCSLTTNAELDSHDVSDAVVLTCCKQRYESIQQTDLFCVTRVSPSKTSTSFMDESNTPTLTYRESLEAKYKALNIKIRNPHLPLLETKNIGSNLNYLTTKAGSVTISRKAERRGRYIYFPPDLVVKYPIPASFLIQAKFLPSCLQRISRLFISRQIQTSVASMFDWSAAGNSNYNARASNMPETYNMDEDMDVECGTEVPGPFLELTGEYPEAKKFKGLCISEAHEPKEAPKFIKSTIELEYMHPNTISRKMKLAKALQTRKTPLESAIREPVNYYRDNYNLLKVNEIQFKSLDAFPDFKKECGPPALTIAEALTLANAHDSPNMERLEFIGDSVLKLFCSSHVYFHFPHANEGQMTSLRNQLVSNANFYLLGKEKGLGEFLGGSIFIPDKTWAPPGVHLLPNVASALARNNTTRLGAFAAIPMNRLEKMRGDELDEVLRMCSTDMEKEQKELPEAHVTYSHTRLGDKNIADCVEALVGAYFQHGGLETASHVMTWLGIKAPTASGEIMNFDLKRRPMTGVPLGQDLYANARAILDRHMPYADQLEHRISHKFKNPLLLLEAFTYPNFVANRTTGCYQRLEFLGDAVLDFLIANHIQNELKGKSPGEMTLLKSSLVNNLTLASYTVKYGFHKYLLYAISKPFQDAIDAFVEFQEMNENDISGDGVTLKTRRTWKSPEIAESVTVPKVLGDIFEALVGGVYIDSGCSLDETWRIIYRLMEKEIKKFSQTIPKNAMMELHEKYTEQKPIFSVVKQDDVIVDTPLESGQIIVKLTVGNKEFLAVGRNKKEAKQVAAKWALSTVET